MPKIIFSKIFTFLLLVLQLISVNGEILKLRIPDKEYHLNEKIDIHFTNNIKCQSGTEVELMGQNQGYYGRTNLQCQNEKNGYLKLPNNISSAYESVDRYYLYWSYGTSQIQTEPAFKLMKASNSNNNKNNNKNNNNNNKDNTKDNTKNSNKNNNKNNKEINKDTTKDNNKIKNNNTNKNANTNNNINKNTNINDNNNKNNNNNINNNNNDKETLTSNPENLNNKGPKLKEMPNNESENNKIIEEPTNINNSTSSSHTNVDSKGRNKILFGVVFLLIGCVMVLSVRLIKTRSENKTIKSLGRQILEDRKLPNPNLVTFPALRFNELDSSSFNDVNNSTTLSEMFRTSKLTTGIPSANESIIPIEDSVVTYPFQNRKDVERSIFSSP